MLKCVLLYDSMNFMERAAQHKSLDILTLQILHTQPSVEHFSQHFFASQMISEK